MKRLLPLFLLLTTLASCTSTSGDLKQMYAEDTEGHKGLGVLHGLQTVEGFHQENEFIEERKERLVRVREYIEEKKLESADDFYYAAKLLSTSAEVEDLISAQACGFMAARLGEERGFEVAAEAIDRYQVFDGKPQCYGTQVEFVEVLSVWRLYPVDPRTTDDQRKAMGIPPLDELRVRVERINERVQENKKKNQ